MALKVSINGKKEELEEEMSISRLLATRGIRPEMVTVELNEKVIERGKYDFTTLKDGDILEFLYYMGGGNVQ